MLTLSPRLAIHSFALSTVLYLNQHVTSSTKGSDYGFKGLACYCTASVGMQIILFNTTRVVYKFTALNQVAPMSEITPNCKLGVIVICILQL